MTRRPNDDARALSLLQRPTRRGFDVGVHVLAPDSALDCDAETWSKRLAVVEYGQVELRTGRGERLLLAEGSIFTTAGLAAAMVHNVGSRRAVIATLARATPEGGPDARPNGT